jgi:putative endonuclease
MGSFFTYILVSESTHQTYVGQTDNLGHRLAEHNDPGNRKSLHTKRRKGPWIVVYWEQHQTRCEAIKRERFLKTGRGREWMKSNISAWLQNPQSVP